MVNEMATQINKISRNSLNSYMIDAHGFSEEDVKEWDDKQDLIADIRNYGWEDDCIEYCG